MATKYKIGSGVRHAREERETPFKAVPVRLRLSPKQRLFITYLGILVASMLILTATSVGRLMQFHQRPVLRGEGLVIGKELLEEPDGRKAYLLRVEVPLEKGRAASDLAAIDEAHWRAFVPGDRVAVFYQISLNGARIRIRECGLVALPAPIR